MTRNVSLLPLAEARQRVIAAAPRLGAETVDLADAAGRVLAEPLVATRDQPPFRSSAMDGYAVRAADTVEAASGLKVVGVSAAGHRFTGDMPPGACVGIFTGAPVPDAADTILIQENATVVDDDTITATEPAIAGRHIREPAIDFATGDIVIPAGTVLDFGEIGLAAATGAATLSVVRRPVVAILATGDELVPPGAEAGDDQIYASGGHAVAALVESAGGRALPLGIARDDTDHLRGRIDAARDAKADLLVTIGGVSVGDHDLVGRALKDAGMTLDFWRIAMRPGKPLMFGKLDSMTVIGLPGNPVSAIVCALLFIKPLIAASLGRDAALGDRPAILGVDLPANGVRTFFLRARLTDGDDGLPVATPFRVQDSSVMTSLVAADALLIRDAEAPPARAGDPCRILMLR